MIKIINWKKIIEQLITAIDERIDKLIKNEDTNNKVIKKVNGTLENIENKLSTLLDRLSKVEKDIIMINWEKTKIDSNMLETTRTFLGSSYDKKFKSFNARLNSIEDAI